MSEFPAREVAGLPAPLSNHRNGLSVSQSGHQGLNARAQACGRGAREGESLPRSLRTRPRLA